MAKPLKAVVVLSGGQDSVTCLGVAIAKHGKENVYAITFDYGQKHRVEITQAELICQMYSIPWELVEIKDIFPQQSSALLDHSKDISASHDLNPKLPASFVPGRNAVMLTIAHAWAQSIGAWQVYTGVCQTDYSGYPDCRSKFIEAIQFSLNMGYECSIQFVTPLMNLTKAETFRLADECHFLGTVINHSHTCYNGDRSNKFEWGYGCGECPACVLRAAGWHEYKEKYLQLELDV
jgi:7-cyano-7-deazaguanine synthase